ncbi:MAG: EcsC family protein [Lachnospiraceae bacterium]
MSRFSWENEWRLQNLKEESFLVKHIMDKTPKWVSLVEKKVPETLQNTLETAFNKAFVAVFEKGSGLIEKTYRKDRQIRLFRANKREIDQEGFNGKNVRKFERQAKRTACKNLAISTVEGIGFGIVGLGIPDIPIFVSVLLKSIYEIALSYGFSYTTDKEKLFILKLIDASLKSGDTLRKKDADINKLIKRYHKEELMQDKDEQTDEFVTELQIIRQIDYSAEALSHELLYGKFVQGTTFVGVIGGTADFTCLKKITDYAALKYKRRFLLRQMPEME